MSPETTPYHRTFKLMMLWGTLKAAQLCLMSAAGSLEAHQSRVDEALKVRLHDENELTLMEDHEEYAKDPKKAARDIRDQAAVVAGSVQIWERAVACHTRELVSWQKTWERCQDRLRRDLAAFVTQFSRDEHSS